MKLKVLIILNGVKHKWFEVFWFFIIKELNDCH